MGDFNITFFIQVINFLIAWFMLDKFFFKPSVTIIRQEEALLKQKEMIVLEKSILLKQSEEKKNATLCASKELFLKACPKEYGDESKVVSLAAFIHVQECDVSTRIHLTNSLVDRLVKRITHG